MRYPFVLPALILLLSLSGADLFAQGIVMERFVTPPEVRDTPRPPELDRRRPAPSLVRLKEHRVKVTIENLVVKTEVTQIFHNPSNRGVEGIYLFPLPDNAAVANFTMSMAGKQVPGELVSSDKAREIYRSIVRRRDDPGLLEYVGRRLLRCSMFPIPPRSDTKITITYGQVLKPEAGLIEFVYPLKSDNFSSGPVAISGEISIQSDAGLATIFSPTHTLDVARRGENSAVCSFEDSRSRADRDLRLLYSVGKKDFGVSLVSTKPTGEDGYFVLTVAPRETARESDILPKDVVFVLDTSGSMGERGGRKLDQAKRALTYALGRLKEKDRFNVISFSTEARSFRETLLPATKENVAAAVEHVGKLEATGGTAIHDALTRAVALSRPDGRVPIVIFLTDGQPTVGPASPAAILKAVGEQNDANARLFVFGVGNDVNTRLLTDLSDQSGGTSHFVGERESIEVKVSTLFDQVASPVLTDARIRIDGAGTFDIYPQRLGDLFKGQQALVVGRYANAGPRAITLSGKIGTREVSFTYETAFRGKPGNDFVPRLWAVRKVGVLLDAIRHNGARSELVDEVKRLGTRYGIVTPYTSYLVLEEGEALRRQWSRRGRLGAPGVAGELFSALKDEREKADDAGLSFGDSEGRGGRVAGKEAVLGARMVKKLREANDAGDTGRGLKTVGGKTFRYVDGVWTDTALLDDTQKREVRRIVYLSEGFDALLSDAELARFLSVGKRARILHKGVVYEIVPE